MPENHGNQNPSDKLDQDADTHQPKRFKGTSPVVLIAVLSFATAGLAIYGSVLLNIHPKPLVFALTCIFSASIFGGLVLRFTLTNLRSRYRIAHGVPTCAAVGVILSSAVGCLIAWNLERPDHVLAFRQNPIVTLELGKNSDVKTPFGQTFLVYNHGPGKIRDVVCQFLWNDPDKLPGRAFVTAVPAGNELGPEMKQAVRCVGGGQFPVFSRKTFVNCILEYSPEPFTYRTNAFFTFCLTKEDGGSFDWLPAGEGESLADFIANVKSQTNAGPSGRFDNQPSRFMDDMAFLGPKIQGMERIDPKLNDGYCMNFMFSFTNMGALTAKEVKYEWGIFDPGTGTIAGPSNNLIPLGRFIQAGKTMCFTQQFDGQFCGPWYDGLMAGKFAWVGEIGYKDESNRDYTMTIRAFRTNGQFDVRIIGKGGQFDEVDKRLNELREK